MVTTLKELERLLKLLRKQGVQDFKMGDIELKLGDLPREQTTSSGEDDLTIDDPYANFPPGMLTPEQLMYYSAGGTPENDPENQVPAQ